MAQVSDVGFVRSGHILLFRSTDTNFMITIYFLRDFPFFLWAKKCMPKIYTNLRHDNLFLHEPISGFSEPMNLPISFSSFIVWLSHYTLS